MRQRWVKFDWSIAVVLSVVLHCGLVWWMLHEQIQALAGMLARGVTNEWVKFRREVDDNQLGEADGKGTAIAPSIGDQMASGFEADLDQPFLSRDPAGMGHVGDVPSQYTGPVGNGELASAMQQSVSASEQPATLRKPAALEPEVAIKPPVPKPLSQEPLTPDGEFKRPAVAASDDPADDSKKQPERKKLPEPIAAKPPELARDVVAMNSASASPARQPGLPLQSADPAPKSDSEIDPFTQTASAELRAGKMVVRSGRKAKLTRPRLSLAGFWDGVGLGHAAVTMKLTIDPDGKVIRAEVLHSSGSNEIDNPICLEAYNWWFDPDKNAAGEPVRTQIPFTVAVFR